MHGRVARSASLVSAMSPRHKLIFIAAAILAASPATEGIKLAIVMQFSGHCLCVKCAAGELESQCVSDGTLVQFNCPVDGFDADDYISWLPEGLVDYEDYSTTATLMAEYSGQGYAIHEVTCDYQQDQYYHAVIIITGETHIMHSILVSVYLSHFLYAHIINTYMNVQPSLSPSLSGAQDTVLPVRPSLQKGDGESLIVKWENPSTTFESQNNVYYHYEIRVEAENGYQSTIQYSLEAHQQWARKIIPLTGLECQQLNISISLPGNCREKTIPGVLLISETSPISFT